MRSSTPSKPKASPSPKPKSSSAPLVLRSVPSPRAPASSSRPVVALARKSNLSDHQRLLRESYLNEKRGVPGSQPDHRAYEALGDGDWVPIGMASASSSAANALAATRAAATAVQANKKKKSKPWWQTVLNIAEDVVPAVLPFLLAAHPTLNATAQRAQMPKGAVRPVALASLPAGTLPAPPASLHGMVGMRDFHPHHSATGVIDAVEASFFVWMGEATSDGYDAGDVVFECDLNPLDPAFAGSALIRLASGYGKYEVLHCGLITVPTCNYTQDGALVAAFFPDPLSVPQGTADTVTQQMTTQSGSDTQPCIRPLAAYYVGDPGSRWKYTDESAGSDERLTVAAKCQIRAATDITAGTSLCNIYLMLRLKLAVASVTDAPGGFYCKVEGAAYTQAGAGALDAPWDAGVASVTISGTNTNAILVPHTDGVYYPAGLPVGTYLVNYYMAWTTATTVGSTSAISTPTGSGCAITTFPGNEKRAPDTAASTKYFQMRAMLTVATSVRDIPALYIVDTGNRADWLASGISITQIDPQAVIDLQAPTPPSGVPPMSLWATRRQRDARLRSMRHSRTLQGYEATVNELRARLDTLTASLAPAVDHSFSGPAYYGPGSSSSPLVSAAPTRR